MSVIVTLRFSADPAKFEETFHAESERVGRIVETAKQHGGIAHRWYAAEGEVMAIDEWPDAESFQAFFSAAEGEIGPLMQRAEVEPPTITFWRKLELGDDIGWED